MKKLILALALSLASYPAFAQESEPLRIEVTQGVVEPLSIALPTFVAQSASAQGLAQKITQVIASDLTGSGLFREIPKEAHISELTNFNAPVSFADWNVINAKALLTGSTALTGDGQLVVQFRLFDVLAQSQMTGLQFVATETSWRRMAHKVADVVYSRLTGEGGYFDSRVVYIAEEGPKGDRKKRLAIMDYDGANTKYLTDDKDIVLAPRFSPNAREIIYTSYETGSPRVYMMNVDSLERRILEATPDQSFAPRFAPDGKSVVLSLSKGGNTDIYSVDIASGRRSQLTSGPAIETAPSYSPDGKQIVFESDRGGRQQIYVMPANGGNATRISFGDGSYGTPVWSPRGDMIAFTKILNGQFHIGVMGVDGSQERLLTRSFLDEGPTWAPNGRTIMFFRETPGSNGAPSLYSVDLTGRILRKVNTPTFGSDPAWSKLLE